MILGEVTERSEDHSAIPAWLRPVAEEAAVLSVLLVADGDRWVVASGSLLTVPLDVAFASWPVWRARQPATLRARVSGEGFDPGPNFVVEPVAGVRVARCPVLADDWPNLAADIQNGALRGPFLRAALNVKQWTSTMWLPSDSSAAAGRAARIYRPLTGVAGPLAPAKLPAVQYSWSLPVPDGLAPRRDRGRLYGQRTIHGWAEALAAIDWTPTDNLAPPASFVVARPGQGGAWIVDALPDYDTGEIRIAIGWDSEKVDPLSCSLLLRSERDGHSLLARHVKLSELPSDSGGPADTWKRSFSDQGLVVRLPRGPRRTDWGAMLISPDGQLLDEMPVALRAERVEITISIDGAKTDGHTTSAGDPDPPPSSAERDEAAQAAVTLEHAARTAAAQRRVSTAGDLAAYLRSRFACVAGELLVLDPHLLAPSHASDALALLDTFDRPVRALSGTLSPETKTLVADYPQIHARMLPDGRATLHDRVWIVGPTALAVGASVNGLLGAKARRRATTVSELPHADSQLWRDQFETWWSSAPREPR